MEKIDISIFIVGAEVLFMFIFLIWMYFNLKIKSLQYDIKYLQKDVNKLMDNLWKKH